MNSLLQARDLYGTAKRREAAARNADFTDLLFRSGFSDIEIKGRTLVLSGSHTPYADLCLQYAQLSRTYDANIDGVSLVSDVAPRRTIKCATPRIASHFVSVAQISPAEILSKQPILIIDGATDSPASDAELGLATQKIRAAMQVQRLKPDAIHLSANEATIYYTNSTYLSEASAIGRIMRVLLAEAPTSIEKFRLIALNASIPVREFDILRAPLERDLSSSLDGAAILQNGLTQAPVPMYNPVLSDIDKSGFPRFSWAIFPQFRQSLFDPNQPFGVQFLAAGLAGLEISRGLSLNIEGEANLYDNFDTSLIVNSPNLPPVRTNFSRYFTKGKNGIGDLEADYRFRLSPDVFAIGRAGYLESMFAGAGGELLWRPENARWALGVDGYEVWQRGFDRLLDLQNYHVFTGHVSLYYQSPWYGLSLALRAGQYLAGDRGLTIELSRRFLTGIEIGVFATKTNVSTADFGEGSFDKGIMITIPLSWGLPVPTQNEFNTVIRPVQRDGGQRLNGDALLWGDTQRQSEGEILDHQEDLIIP